MNSMSNMIENREVMMVDSSRFEIAKDYFNKAYKLQVEGKIDEAIDNYRISIDLYPTAEAHTFLGWAYSMLGKFEDAIDECHIAIEIDVDYGNPYNDIGSYLVTLERYDEAITWFEKAINAPRYLPRHFPYYNLGKIYEKKGNWYKALEYYNDTIKINPDYEPAKKAFIKITTLLN